MAAEPTHTKTVLIVDDEPFFRKLLSDLFGQKQCRVMTAATGEEAVTQAGHLRPDVIILDFHMPGLDGIATCKILKANQATSRIPVIILTAEESVELNQMAFEAGAHATVLKSMSQDRLMNIVDLFLPTGTPSGSPKSPKSPGA
jgi:CheY-like chemotaxis protein